MVKYFCDRCGKEIRGYSVAFEKAVIAATDKGWVGAMRRTLCHKCAEAFDIWLKESVDAD